MKGNFTAQRVQRTSKGFPDRSLLIQAMVLFQRRTCFVPNIQTVKYYTTIAMFLVTSPIVIKVPTRGLLAVETMHAIVQWLANLNIKRNATSMFVNKKHRYRPFYSFLLSDLVSGWQRGWR